MSTTQVNINKGKLTIGDTKKGDWIIISGVSGGGSQLAIVTDETRYDGKKVGCVRICDECMGTIAYWNKSEPIKAILVNVNINYTTTIKGE